MSNDISRKDFLKNFGIATLGFPMLSSFSLSPAKPQFDSSDSGAIGRMDMDRAVTRRGSWVQYGDVTAGDITLADKQHICQIVLASDEHSAVQQAARFLAADIGKITGQEPKIQQQEGKRLKVACIHLVTLGHPSIPSDVDVADIKGKWEAHKIITRGNDLWLIGSDFRGTAYAAYTLSERIGIDPLYLWTGYTPKSNEVLILKKVDYTCAGPAFKYRGFFHDDEDILPRPFEYGGYPLRVGDIDLHWYEKYFETALRLKMNMVAPYTRVHRRYEVQKCASDWGLIYTSHHYDILLSNPFGLIRFGLAEKRNIKPEWNWTTNKEGMSAYWRGGVLENKDLNCIWPVGLRGTNDYPYQFAKGTTEKEQTAVFNQVIETQVDTVKELLTGEQRPVYTFTLWDEMIKKYESDKENFVLPDDVMIIWSDNMDGKMTHLPSSLGKWKHGIYYHLAMYGGGVTKQGANTVSPFTITEAFQKSLDSGATEYMLVNVSELRDYIMGARQIADICWAGAGMLDKERLEARPGHQYLKWWCNEYYGSAAVAESVALYNMYFDFYDHPTKLWFAADVIWRQLEELVKKISGQQYELTSSKDLAQLQSRENRYRKAMDLFDKASLKMGREQQQFFFENTKLGLSFDGRPTEAALLLHKALLEKDVNRSWDYIHQAMAPLEKLELDILKAERPPFDKWYRDTWIRGTLTPLNLHRSFLLLRAFIASGGKVSRPPKLPGHDNLAQSRLWNDFLEASESLSDPLSRE